MKLNLDNESTIRRYLLGLLEDPERFQVEERFFNDNAYFERVSAAEDDLIDDYAQRRLGPAERSRFEEYCLSSAKIRDRVEFAKAFDQKLQRSAPARAWWHSPVDFLGRQRPALRFAAAILAIAAIATGLFLMLRAPKPGPPDVFAFVLRPGLTRDPGTVNRQRVPARAALVRIQAVLETQQSYSTYRAALRTVQEKPVWAKDGLQANGDSTVTIEIPSSLLNSDDYLLTIAGVRADGQREEIADYSFRIVR